jgi:farnesyl diphosphate synthase
MMMNSIATEFQTYIDRINNKLDTVFSDNNSSLHNAIRYSLLSSGKRLRPLLIYTTGLGLQTKAINLDIPAIAVEMIHSYSLIHDDLPCMDDDNFRRGQPTCHKAFNEALAVLAGDALNTQAFNCIAASHLTAAIKCQIISTLTAAAGAQGMIHGQTLDLEAENQSLSLQQLQDIHQHKTGALITACLVMAGHCANADNNLITSLERIGNHLGLAFQIQDDLLDVQGDFDNLGKQPGADVKLAKATYPSILGIDNSQALMLEHYNKATQALDQLPQNFEQLQKLIHLTSIRTN